MIVCMIFCCYHTCNDTAVHPTDYATNVLRAIFRLNRPRVHLLQVLWMSPQCQLPIGPDLQFKMNMSLGLSRPDSLRLWFSTLGVTPAYWHVCKETHVLLWMCMLHLCTACIQKVEGYLTMVWNTYPAPWTMFFAESVGSILLGVYPKCMWQNCVCTCDCLMVWHWEPIK